MNFREFDHKHLATMKTVYPTGFTFRQERGLYTSTGDGKTMNFQLTIEPDYKDMQLPKSSIKNNSAILITRRLKFENKLLEIIKGHHQVYIWCYVISMEDFNQILELHFISDLPILNFQLCFKH